MYRHNTYVVHDALTGLIVATLVLACLKILDVIDWSWWGVFAPVLLVPSLVGLGVIYCTVIVATVIVRLAVESLVERLWK